ncbi:MAG: amidohydrolase family protein [Spirochaeta sp.]|nr:amidohydrolase family protein [Spirochaeta sp.]
MIIKDTTLLSFADFSIRKNIDVLIAGNRIAKIGEELCEREQLCSGHEVINGRGLYLIPGLVNAHAHTGMTLLRGAAEDVKIEDWFNKYIWMYEQNLTPDDVYFGTLLGAAEMLLAGVTLVADHYFFMDRAWQAYKDIGIRADLSWALFGTGEDWQATYRQALDFTEKYLNRDPRLTISLGPHSPYICSDEFLRECVKQAETLKVKLHIHVSEEKTQLNRSLETRGKTPVEVLHSTGILRPGTILAHAYYATDDDLVLIRQSGAGVAHCAKTYLKFGNLHDFLPRALAAGINLAFGTDGPCSNNTMNIFEVARDAALLAKSSIKDAERAPIKNILPLLSGSRVLGLPGNGEIIEGAPADLVLIDPASPNMQPEHNIFANILYSLGERNIDTVMVDGKVVVRGGKLVDFPLAGGMAELYREIAKIKNRTTRTGRGGPMQSY